MQMQIMSKNVYYGLERTVKTVTMNWNNVNIYENVETKENWSSPGGDYDLSSSYNSSFTEIYSETGEI